MSQPPTDLDLAASCSPPRRGKAYGYLRVGAGEDPAPAALTVASTASAFGYALCGVFVDQGGGLMAYEQLRHLVGVNPAPVIVARRSHLDEVPGLATAPDALLAREVGAQVLFCNSRPDAGS